MRGGEEDMEVGKRQGRKSRGVRERKRREGRRKGMEEVRGEGEGSKGGEGYVEDRRRVGRGRVRCGEMEGEGRGKWRGRCGEI